MFLFSSNFYGIRGSHLKLFLPYLEPQVSVKQVFWNSARLTVEEHIYFYGRLKGLNPSELQTEMDQMIKDVDLLHKRKDLVKNLSGEFVCMPTNI